MVLIGLLLGTLTAALLSSAAEEDSDGIDEADLRAAWASFRLSLVGAEVPVQTALLFDLMEERGHLPPGWILHPRHGMFHLIDVVLTVVDDDTPLDIMYQDRKGESLILTRERDAFALFPIRIFIHASPIRQFFNQDFAAYHAIVQVIQVARRWREDCLETRQYDPSDPGVISRAFHGSMERDDLGGFVFDFLLPDEVEHIWRRAFQGEKVTADTIMDEGSVVGARDEEFLTWGIFEVDEFFSEDLETLLAREGIMVVDRNLCVQAADDVAAISESRADRLALKHGYVLARIPDSIGSRYWRNYVIHPLPESPELLPMRITETVRPDDERIKNSAEFLRRFPRRKEN